MKLRQQNYVVEEGGVRNRETGKLMDDIEVFFGLNMMIAVTTLHLTVPR